MSKQVLVIGATGRTGLLIVEQALARGFAVTVLARRPEVLGELQSRVSVVQGDVLDRAAVSRAVAGKEAVLCALGPGRDSPPTLCSEGTQNLVSAMEAQGVRRLVCITGALIGHPEKCLGWLYREMRMAQGSALQDRQRQEQLIQGSGLDWTLVRPPRLTRGKPQGLWRVGEDISIKAMARISRADLAHFMVQQVEDAHFLRRGVAISY
ncbi:NAD(P)-dependent oxidoreductase [Hyalangium gracile]|uniref:NAD(P)-dependent oxidoreductase n=1 Tax=Hyalangium gracile TaxID=394092 RepID=UPI001CCAAC32|nr:SDR family oxidoreductase [Hyalangium gracile]